MNCSHYEAVAGFEHRFWLQILGDHSRFIMTSLSPVEKGAIKKAHSFIEAFDELLAQARRPLNAVQLADLTAAACWSKTCRPPATLSTMKSSGCRTPKAMPPPWPPASI